MTAENSAMAEDDPGATAVGPQVVTIRYCVDCRWLLRAQWYAGELLQTFEDALDGVTLVPSRGGMFRVEVAGRAVWNRKTDGGFPDVAELKRRVRDVVAPGMSLGHTDRSGGAPAGDDLGDGPDGADGTAQRI